jgi:hypothetical protein
MLGFMYYIIFIRSSNFFSEEKRKSIAVWAFLMVFTSWLNVLAVYFQNGAYEFAFLYGVCNSCGFVMTSKVLLNILEPLFDVRMLDKTNMRKSINYVTVGLVLLLMVLAIAMSATSRLHDSIFNSIAYAYFIAFLTGGMMYPGLVSYHGSVLLKQLAILMNAKGVPAETKYGFSQLRKKIIAVRRGAGVFSAVCFFWYAEIVALPIVSSIPFHYLMTFLIFHTMLLLCTGVIILIRPKSAFSVGNVDSMLISSNPLSAVDFSNAGEYTSSNTSERKQLTPE